MDSDEEVIERAVKKALEEHFKKPGSWIELPVKPLGELHLVPPGEVHEVFVFSASGTVQDEKGRTIFTCATASLWVPCLIQSAVSWRHTKMDVVNGNITTNLTSITNYLKASEGFILHGGEGITDPGDAFVVRYRRRFDRE